MNIHKFLANALVLAGFIAIPFIPFIVLGESTFFPFVTGKNFAFRAVVEIMFSAWVVLAVIDPAYRPKKGYIMGAFVTLLALITLSAIFGANTEKSFWSNFERMEGVVTYFHLFAYFVVASTVLTVRDFWRPYLNLHLFAGAIMALYGVMQWAGELKVSQGGIRIDGTLGNSEYMGTYALFNIFIALFLLSRESLTTTWGRVRMATYGFVVLLQTFAIYHSGTRGAMLGLLVGLGLATLIIAIFEKHNKILKRWAIGALVALVIFVGGFIAFRDASFIKASPVLSRFAAISLNDNTTHSRLMVWAMAYEGFQERPVLGWGMDNFDYVFSKYYDPNMWGQEPWFDRAHNVLFDWLVAGGALGLIAYLSLFGFAVYCIWRKVDELSTVEKSILTGLLVGYIFQNLFVFDNITSLIYFGTILAYVAGISYKREEYVEGRDRIVSKDGEDLTIMVSGGAIILAVVLLYMINYNGFYQNLTLIRALTERSDSGVSHNLELFKEALAYNSIGTSEAREHLSAFSMSAFDSTKEVSDLQKEFIALATSEAEKQAEEHPNDARAQLILGSYFSKIGQYDKALVYLNKALEISPKKQLILFQLGNAYYNKGDTVKAEEVFKRAYELAPEYAEAEKFYIQVLTAYGKKDEAMKVFKDRPIQGVTIQ